MNSAQPFSYLFIVQHPLATTLGTTAFAVAARSARWLTRTGAVAAWIVGMIVLGLGGVRFLVPLLVFFLSSSILSKLTRRGNRCMLVPSAKGSTRDAAQVWANGGPAAAIVVLFISVAHHWQLYQTRELLILYLAALGAVNADTWSTEIGSLSKRPPRLLRNWKQVPAGTSGAISALGVAAALAGALAVVLSAKWLWRLDAVEFIAATWAAFLGSLTDSVLGAGLQAQYRDPITGLLTDRAEAHGHAIPPARGHRWMTNDVINFLAGLSAVAFAWVLLHYAGGPAR